MGLSLRPAAEADRAELGALKLRATLAWGDHVEALKAIPEVGQVAAELIPATFVAERAGLVAGFAAVVIGEGGQAELEDLFVEPAAWRTGVGRMLVEEAVRRACAQGVRSLQVVAGARAAGFYEACGFEPVGIVATLFEPATLMQRRL